MILFVSHSDWANVGYLFAKSLQSIGKDAVAVTKKRHPYSYPHQANLIRSNEELQSLAKKADVIVWMHSVYTPLKIDLAEKKLAVFHGGSAYRNNHKAVNAVFNPHVQVSLIQTTNLWGLGAKNEKLISPPVDTVALRPIYVEAEKIVVGHYPSAGKKWTNCKGTKEIEGVIYRLKKNPELKYQFEFRHSMQLIPWVKNIQRVSECDIYIESHGQVGAGFGLSGLEAAALGKVVITRWLKPNPYFEEYGITPLCIANTTTELYNNLVELIVESKSKRRELRKAHHEWVEENHSFEAVGRRLKKILEV